MSLPTLEKLLEDKTVFVLGAGSSKPYGFPLWDDLKKVILEKCDQLSDTSEYSELGLAYWESCLNKDDEKSVDTLAKEANDSSRKGFQTIVGRYLISCEASDLESNKSDWVEVFHTKVLDLCRDKSPSEILPNITIVNLNYDRCFCHRFSATVKALYEGFPGDWERQAQWPTYGTSFYHHIHPHGAIGTLPYAFMNPPLHGLNAFTFINPNSMNTVVYGDTDSYEKAMLGNQIHIMPVDVVGPDTWHNRSNISYVRANQALQQSRNVVFIGVSKDGYDQAHLSIPDPMDCFSINKEELGGRIISSKSYALSAVQGM